MVRRVQLFLAIFVVLACSVRQPSVADARPNIVLVLIDDMGWPDLACYGHEFHETPCIDRLASQGMRFTSFYATPVCSSTRATIETGQNSARVGITDFLPGHRKPFARLVVPAMPNHLDHEYTTPGEAFRQAGYATGYFGKWHLGRGDESAPGTHGYEVTEATLGTEFQKAHKGRKGGPKKMIRLTDQAIWFVEQQTAKQKPFFLHLSHKAVHIPVQALEKSVRKYERKTKPDHGVNNPVYAAMIANLDHQVGRLVECIDRLGISESTIVIFTSDNGGLRQVYTGNGAIISTNAPLRGEKGTLFEGGIRVPMIVRWPGVVSPNTVCHAPAATWDLFPTFCSMANVDPPQQTFDGKDLTPAMRKTDASLDRDALYFHYPHYHHSHPASAIRQGDYKLIHWLEDDRVELFNLATDIGESQDLADTMPEKARALKAKLATWRSGVGARMPTNNPNYDPAKADIWYKRNKNEPLNTKAIAKELEKNSTKSSYPNRPKSKN